MIIVVQPTLFTRDTKIVLLDDEMQTIKSVFKSPVSELSIKIPELCKDSSVKKVLLIGNKNFTSKIGEAVKSNAISKYSLDIEIEYANK